MKARNTWTRFAYGVPFAPAALGALGLALGGCLAPPVETPVTTTVQETDVRVEQSVKDKVDILFMVDDSNSMAPKQNELKARFPELIKILDNFAAMGTPAHYHIGVVTSDLGAGPGGSGGSGCAAGGLGARLQPLGRGHGASCVPPTKGLNFIDYDQRPGGTNNLPTGVNLADEFTCMASVGTGGCGFEHQLESTYRALHDCMPAADGSYPNCSIPENQGFLRPNSILAVVWVTDEDDCSADPSTDLFDQNKTTTYGPRVSYRCSNYGVQCNGSLMPYADSGGPLSNCVAAPNPGGAGPGKLFDVQRYIDFFRNTPGNGGVRADPTDVILAAIDAPSEPVQSLVGNSDTGAACPAGAMVGTTGCQVYLGHSCNASADFFGDPAVRVNQVIASVNPTNQVTSICAQDYTSALTALGMKIVSKLGIACLSSPITDINNPDCVVEDRANADNTVVDSIRSCTATGNTQPCWKYEENDKCPAITNPYNGSVTQGSVTVVRDMNSIPPGTSLHVACATIAIPAGTSPSPSP